MSSIITGVLNLTVGLLWSKFRDSTANKLKEGDLTDEKCRQVIVRELDDIKTKLDGLSRKDLLSSVSFLKDGIEFLKLSQAAESTDGETSVVQEHDEEDMMMMAVTGGSSLSQAISTLNIVSNERFRSAKSLFKQSNTKATEAFNNEALSSEDRIMATKLRVISRIFENLEDPEAAANSCVLYLKELHDLPPVREIFSVHLSGGMKSLFSTTKRLDQVMSVTMINFVVFDFAKKFTKKAPRLLHSWPTLELEKRTYNPVIPEDKIFKKMKESGARLPTKFTLTSDSVEIPLFCQMALQVNSTADIIGVVDNKHGKVFKFTAGEGHLFSEIPQEETEANCFKLCSLAIDEEDNVYIVTSSKQTDNVVNFKLFVFDANGNMKHQSPLKSLNGNIAHCSIAVTKYMIVIHKEGEDRVFVCDSSGQLKFSFGLAAGFCDAVVLSISEKNEIIVAERRRKVVFIYTEEGELKKRFEVPSEHRILRHMLGVAFNHVTKEIVVLTENMRQFYLSSYSVTGQLRRTFQLPHNSIVIAAKISSHPSGPVAIIYNEHVIYLQ